VTDTHTHTQTQTDGQTHDDGIYRAKHKCRVVKIDHIAWPTKYNYQATSVDR